MANLNPRFEEFGPVTIAGIVGQHQGATMAQSIPLQWRRFESEIAFITGRRDPNTYGILYHVLSGAREFTYMSGVSVGDFATTPEYLGRSLLQKMKFAKFAHDGDVTTIRNTIDAILSQWLPSSGQTHFAQGQRADVTIVPDFIERYGPGYDPKTGRGDIEVWLPVK
ncbi:MAG: GyrI-like domain-containing protein [Hyphomonadaceae bacterium]